ncbi:ArsR/SmtB family transcription factor [Kribbella flavida]|uniref:ArsR/SmtB family transcription factor n=1 Tax=Kribbella flavida TaxID=182640 RepID=UPI00019BF78D|nr:metalloregulator ArsR/SmtB family transcription factor [Kribbella flavida]
MDLFAVLADRTRRHLLQCLSSGGLTVGELQEALGASQPTVSKHLRVLRDHHLVRVKAQGPLRHDQLDPRPLQELDGWLASFRGFWAGRLDALGAHLDDTDTKEHS